MSLDQPTSFNKEQVKKTAFHEEKMLVVSIDDPRLPWQDREFLKQIGEKIYGKPRSGLQMKPDNRIKLGQSNGRSW